ECDDGNLDDTDACPACCAVAIGGDGYVWADDEACDDGNAASGDGCAGCQIECNNGTIDEATGRCYQLRAPDTWNSTLCLGGAYRLVISTTEEMAFLSGVVGRVWTAGHYVQDKFVWQTGEPFIPAVWQGAAPAGQEGDALAFDRGNAALVVEPKSTMHPILCERDAAGRY
ncbi:MAG: hypothetical protein KC731_42060, partial [Myxococcales bacterium]|nr:hypothetical protein [Myxococcales bacterium]